MENQNTIVPNENVNGVCRSRQAWKEFFELENDLYFPLLPAFTGNFINQVLKGNKKLLSMKQSKAPVLKQAKNDQSFNRDNLFRIVKSDPQLSKYIPDTLKIKDSNRIFLITVSINYFLIDYLLHKARFVFKFTI